MAGWYFAVNPALERTFHGPDVKQGIGFSPAAKVGYDFSKVVSAGFEYYADYGRIGNFDSLREQQQQIFAVTDLNVSPKWEINIGVGVGPTAATDHLIIKGILGRRFNWGHHAATDQVGCPMINELPVNEADGRSFIVGCVTFRDAQGAPTLRSNLQLFGHIHRDRTLAFLPRPRKPRRNPRSFSI